MTQPKLATRRMLGAAIVLAALASLVLIHRHTTQVAEERLEEFNRRVPDFMKKGNWALKETGPRRRLGLEVTESVGLVDISDGTFYKGSAVLKQAQNEWGREIWEVVDGKAALLSGNILWSVTTDTIPVIFVMLSMVVGGILVLWKRAGPSKKENQP